MSIGFTPIYRIIKDDQDITDRFNTQTTEIQVDLASGNGNNDRFAITLDDRDFRLARPEIKAKLSIYLGYQESGLSFMGTFSIDEITFEGPPRLIRMTGLQSGMQSLMKAPAIQEFDNKSVKEILEELGKKAGVPVMVEQGLGEKKIPFKNQAGISGFHLLHELERQFDAVAKVSKGKLVFLPRDSVEDAEGRAMAMLILDPHHIAQWSVKHSKRSEHSSVKAAYWDKDKNETRWIEEQVTLNGRKLSEDENPYRVNRKFGSKEEAETFAKSRANVLARSTGEATVMLSKGNPWVKEQMPVLIRGMRDGVNGYYIIDNVTHSFTKDGGLTTRFMAKPPGAGSSEPGLDEYEPLGVEPGRKIGDFTVGSSGRVAGPV